MPASDMTMCLPGLGIHHHTRYCTSPTIAALRTLVWYTPVWYMPYPSHCPAICCC